MTENKNPPLDPAPAPKRPPREPGRHPLLGCMKGTVRFADDYDPAEPACPDWGRRAYGEDRRQHRNDPRTS